MLDPPNIIKCMLSLIDSRILKPTFDMQEYESSNTFQKILA